MRVEASIANVDAEVDVLERVTGVNESEIVRLAEIDVSEMAKEVNVSE